MAFSGEKHVMLSYNGKSQNVVKKVYDILREENIPVWADIDEGMNDNIWESMAHGIEDAAVVCCFMTPDYQKSKNCELELSYARKQGKRIIPCMLTDRKQWKPSGWLGLITAGLSSISFENSSEENIRLKAKELIYLIKKLPPPTSESISRPSYLFELIRSEYKRNRCIELKVNPEWSFPIEQSYINLAIVETKEKQEKEKKLGDIKHWDEIIGSFEDIYNTKSAIDVKDIFEKCNDPIKQVLVFGQAGIGKSTFCRYVTWRWAKGEIWAQYDLVVLISLRRLTQDRYPPGRRYSPVDLVEKEYFPFNDLSDEDKRLWREQVSKSQVLWVLDGYDEFVQNIPEQLNDVFDHLRQTQHHILTSRPYLSTLSYAVKMEITGFTDGSIPQYVVQFFDQCKNAFQDASTTGKRLLSFLKSNPSIWGIAHIPANLELICSLWSDTDFSETKQLTITALYDKITEWLCRRYLTKQNVQHESMRKRNVYEKCHKELAFLESAAYHGMQDNTIILRPELLEKAETEAEWSLTDYRQLLDIGILNSLNNKPTGTRIEAEKDHYFVHRSFQEHFAARYLTKALLHNPARQKAVDFIKRHKYDLRFAVVFTFASGLLDTNGDESSINAFWDSILGEPLDLVGLRHIQLTVACIEEMHNNSNFRRRIELMDSISKWISYAVTTDQEAVSRRIRYSLRNSVNILNEPRIMDILLKLVHSPNHVQKKRAFALISKSTLVHPHNKLIDLLVVASKDQDPDIRWEACQALGRVPQEAGTKNVINALVAAFSDPFDTVRLKASSALVELGEKTSTADVSSRLVTALSDRNDSVRQYACETLGSMREKAATGEAINSLTSAFEDENECVREYACEALSRIGEKAATSDVINRLLHAIKNENIIVKMCACKGLGRMGEKAATSDVIDQLITVLDDPVEIIRVVACEGLVNVGEKAVTEEVIRKLTTLLEDKSEHVIHYACAGLRIIGKNAVTDDAIRGLVIKVGDPDPATRCRACLALGGLGESAATVDVIDSLITLFGDTNKDVRSYAYEAVGKIGGKEAATPTMLNGLITAILTEKAYGRHYVCEALGKMVINAVSMDVISPLVSALWDQNNEVRQYACEALGKMGDKFMTTEVICSLATALRDEDEFVRLRACEALIEFGPYGATAEIIHALVATLTDCSNIVRQHAFEALGSIGEKAATNEVINGLTNVLGNKIDRQYACDALWRIGEMAATSDVINQLMDAVGDTDPGVRWRAWRALERMGEKAANLDVISRLISVLDSEKDTLELVLRVAATTLNRILIQSSVMLQLDSVTVSKLLKLHKNLSLMENIPVNQCITVFLRTGNIDFLPIIIRFLFEQGSAVTVIDKTIMTYGVEGISAYPITNEELCAQLIKGLLNQTERLRSCGEDLQLRQLKILSAVCSLM